jgi:hypothetical protein
MRMNKKSAGPQSGRSTFVWQNVSAGLVESAGIFSVIKLKEAQATHARQASRFGGGCHL